MKKNSINEVAKTYQRLVEAARQSPPMSLEAPDSDEVDTYSPTGDPASDSALRQADQGIIQGILNQINDILQQLANCNQTNNCEYLKSEYIRLTRYLQALQGLVEAAPPMMLPEPMEDIDTPDPNVRSNDDFRRNVLHHLTIKDYTQFINYERALRQCYANPGSCSDTEIAQYEEWIRQYSARLQYYQQGQ